MTIVQAAILAKYRINHDEINRQQRAIWQRIWNTHQSLVAELNKALGEPNGTT